MSNFKLHNCYTDIEAIYKPCLAEPVESPDLFAFNRTLADELDESLAQMDEESLTAFFSGNEVATGSVPVAMAYAGHQFGHFNPYLGDGRAVYLGSLKHRDGHYRDIQLKGSGRTEFSRQGDGRSALGPVIREYIVSEAMYRLGVPTTRALAAVSTGEKVFRTSLKPGGIMTRVATSFIRVGSFQYFAMQQDIESLGKLVDCVVERNYPDILQADNKALALFDAVAQRQAKLIAQWMSLGFIHGVMNTDNMSVAGETIDYGPCAFIDEFRMDKVFSSIDTGGRYAYGNQPNIGHWNLSRLAECLLPLFADEQDKAIELGQACLNRYIETYHTEWLSRFRAKCGLLAANTVAAEEDKQLLQKLFKVMEDGEADFSLSFYQLSQLDTESSAYDQDFLQLFAQEDKASEWLQEWRKRLALQDWATHDRQRQMLQVNPVYIPRNHQIEAVIQAAEEGNDFAPFHALFEVLQNPYEWQQGKDHFMQAPRKEERVYQTFCGT